jgi:DNA primase
VPGQEIPLIAISVPQSARQLNNPLPLLSARAVKARVRLLAYVSKYVHLKHRGRNWFGLCPFHKERHPSFGVRPDRELWFCFGCGKGGDVFTFEQCRSGCTFPEAVRRVAQNAGLLSYCAAENTGLVYGRTFPKRSRAEGSRQ